MSTAMKTWSHTLTDNQYSKQIFGYSIIFARIFVGFVIIKHNAIVEAFEGSLGLLLFSRDWWCLKCKADSRPLPK